MSDPLEANCPMKKNANRRLAVFALAATQACSAGAWGLFEVCNPNGWTIDVARPGVPVLAAPDRRNLEARAVDVPDLPARHAVLDLPAPVIDVPLLAAPTRPDIVAAPVLPIELPPTRGAPSLPAALLDVPVLAAPERPELPAQPQPPMNIAAPPRPIDLGERGGPALQELHACTPALVLALPCRLASRADMRGNRWPSP
jgi:hypothetical protein